MIYTDEFSPSECHGQDPRQVESVKRNLAGCYAVDLRAQGKLLRSRYGRQRVLHFYLPDGRLFVPFKLRESKISGDPCYGYVDLDQVARLLPGDPPTILLHSGTRLPLYSNISSARLAYFLGLEILSDIRPPEEHDQNLLGALQLLRQVLSSANTVSPEPTHPKKVSKFLPIT